MPALYPYFLLCDVDMFLQNVFRTGCFTMVEEIDHKMHQNTAKENTRKHTYHVCHIRIKSKIIPGPCVIAL